MFQALVLNQNDKQTTAAVTTLEDSALPSGEVTVAVDYSSLNYKDGLAITGKGKIIREFPMVPGIDFAGTVIDSADQRYAVGDEVILTGWGVGENHWGGMAEKARVKADWLVKTPTGLTNQQAMTIGTAGLTAMLCVNALRDNQITPDSGSILVTGASGGVGSVAITLLSALGYHVTAVTGRVEENTAILKQLGADEIISREMFSQAAKPLEKSCWAGAIDAVGSQTLAKLLAQMNYGGAVAACGLAGGMDLPTTVMPFILRGVKLLGIDSVYCPYAARTAAWQDVVELLPKTYYQTACQTISLNNVVTAAEKIIAGQITGRVLIDMNG